MAYGPLRSSVEELQFGLIVSIPSTVHLYGDPSGNGMDGRNRVAPFNI